MRQFWMEARSGALFSVVFADDEFVDAVAGGVKAVFLSPAEDLRGMFAGDDEVEEVGGPPVDDLGYKAVADQVELFEISCRR